jgi:flagellar protein FlaG
MSIQNIPAANMVAAVAATTAGAAPAPAQQSSAAAVIPPTQAPKALESANSLRQVAADMEKYVRDSGRNLQFQVDDGTGQVVVRVVDAASGDVIRQIPSEELLRLARSVSSICDECA